jgi:hypothetical protein
MRPDPPFEPSHHPLDIFQPGRADLVQLMGLHLIVEMHHTVSVTRHILKQRGFPIGQHLTRSQPSRYLLILGHALPKSLGQDMPSKVQQGFQGTAKV